MALVLGTIGVVMSIRKVPECQTLNPRPQLEDFHPAFQSILPRKVQSQTPKTQTLNPQPGDLNPQVKQFHQGRYIYLKLAGKFEEEEEEETLPIRPPTPPSDGEPEDDE